MRFALVCTEIAPFSPGGIAPVSLATAQELAASPDHQVDLFVPSHFRWESLRLRALGIPALNHPRIRWIWVDPVDGELPWTYRWAQGAADALHRTYEGREAPDVVEFQDYLGTGALALEAAAEGRSSIASSRRVVRVHSTAEMVQAVDGHIPAGGQWPVVHAMERQTLRLADTLLVPSLRVAEVYDAFYEGDLAAATELWPPFLIEGVGKPTWPNASARRPLELAFVGRMQATKGVLQLAHAIADVPDARFTITFVGGDTDTAPDGGSMLAAVSEVVGRDERVHLLPARPRHRLAEIVRRADAVLVTSRWEAWGNVALEALAANRPVIGSRIGALESMLVPGLEGTGVGPELRPTIAAALARFADEPSPLRRAIAESRPLQHFRSLTDSERFVEGYAALASSVGRVRIGGGATRPHAGEALEAALQAPEVAGDHDADVERARKALARLPAGAIAG